METPTSAPKHDAARRTYDALASRYDAWTDHPAYPGWIRSLEALARSYGLSGTAALDVGCGTGKSTEPLQALGYAVTGVDRSPEMLARWRERLGPSARCVEADLRALPALGAFDYVTMVNDVVNYVDAGGLRAAVAGLARNLRPGGIGLFDTSTVGLYRALYAADEVRVRPAAVFAWHGTTPANFAAGGVATADLYTYVPRPDGAHDLELTHHVQWHHPEERVRAAIADAGLELLGVHGQFEEGPPVRELDADRHIKAVWVMTRA
jgi:SAM-dependent methyltransferase